MSETRIYNDILYLNPNIPNNNFEFAPTPLSTGGVGMYIEVTMNNSVIEGTSNEAFQALWGELQIAKQVISSGALFIGQQNSAELF